MIDFSLWYIKILCNIMQLSKAGTKIKHIFYI